MNDARPCGGAVPERYIGLWQRTLLETPGGERDTTTQAFWLQTETLYADIRVPAGRPDFTHTRALGECSEAQVLWLLRQQGFAGKLSVQADVCTWRRAIDYQPPAAFPDVGRMAATGDALVEHGVHVAYREEWQRLQGPSDDNIALRLEQEAHSPGQCTEGGVLVALGDYFLFARGRPSLRESRQGWERTLHRLDFEISFGLRRGGARPWEIHLSTLPWREGQPLFAPGSEPRRAPGARRVQTSLDGSVRHWRLCHQGAAFTWFD